MSWNGQRRVASRSLSIVKAALAVTVFMGAFFVLAVPEALAQTLTLDLGAGESGSFTGRILQVVALMTILSLAPSILITMTSFTRIIVVLSLVRSALGVQQTPPNMVLISLALFMTFFIMAPVFEQSWTDGIRPLMDEEITHEVAFEGAISPVRRFMMTHARDRDIELFAEVAKTGKLETPDDVPLTVLIPAFMISELRRAFEIGFLLFVPFLIIDMVTASILMSMGMMMLPPVMISLPFKIVFFVLVDGWYLVAGSLIRSYGI